MGHRKSCSLLAPEEILTGKTPTNATTAAIVAGVQVQEAIKYLVGKPEMLSLVGKCWVYTGDSMDTYVTRYSENDWCIAHDRYSEILSPTETPSTLKELFSSLDDTVRQGITAIDLEEDLICLVPCDSCGGEPKTKLRSAFDLGEGRCPTCGEDLTGEIFSTVEPNHPITEIPINDLMLPKREVITLRGPEQRLHYLVHGVSR
jgi:adenylyltransferase/sulfurtransferase